MKKALILTDCSIDSALALNRWLDNQPDGLIDLTVVHTYTLPQDAGYSLKATPYREAKQEAIHRVTRWIGFLPHAQLDQLKTETLLGTDPLVITIYLLLRRYDYLLLHSWQEDALSAFSTCQAQITTQLHWLDLPESVLYTFDQLLAEASS